MATASSGHLYFDQVITKMLTEALLKPDAINANKMSFYQKLQLILALGLIQDDIASPITFINNLMNKIAHNLNFEIIDQHVLDLANCTPKNLRDFVINNKDRASGPLKLNEIFEVLLFYLDIIRQNLAFDRLHERKSVIRLRTTLEKTAGAIYRR